MLTLVFSVTNLIRNTNEYYLKKKKKKKKKTKLNPPQTISERESGNLLSIAVTTLKSHRTHS